MKINNIIFDLGNVMVKWSPETVLPDLDKKFEKIFFESKIPVFERVWEQSDIGNLSEIQLIKQISTLTEVSIDKTRHALKMLKHSLLLNKPMCDLMTGLYESGYNLYCLSNISKSFADYLMDKYQFFKYFKGIVFSYEEKCIKPDIQIYKNLLSKFSISAADTLFIDDRLENILSAQSLGIASIQYYDHKIFLKELSNKLPAFNIIPA